MTEKSCTACKQVKPVEEFGINRSKKDGLQLQCKPCRRTINTNYYHASKEAQNPKRYARKAKAQDKCRQIVWNFLKENPCIDCEEPDIVVLQFDHVRGEKKYNISEMMGAGLAGSLIDEMKKCVVRCANCHTRKTARDFGWLKVLQS